MYDDKFSFCSIHQLYFIASIILLTTGLRSFAVNILENEACCSVTSEFFFKWLTATIRLQCQGCACCHSFYKKLNIQQYSSGVLEQVIFISLLCLIRSLTIMLTHVLSSLSLPQGRIVCCVPLECVLARIVGKTSEKKAWICPHKANSRRSGICMLLSSAHPQGIGPPRVRFKKVNGKETATSMHRSAQNSSLPSEFLLQSGWVPKFFQALRCYFMDLVCRRS